MTNEAVQVTAGRLTKFCQNCGAQIDEKAVICPKCGVSLSSAATTDPKSRWTAVLLAFFLGGVGIHKLYLKQGRWWLYLLFCWTFIPALIAFFEGIKYILMSDQEFHTKYG